MNTLASKLKSFGQEHLLAHWEQLSEAQRCRLQGEIEQIDLALIDRLWRLPPQEDEIRRLADEAEPPPAFRLGDADNRFSPQEASARGEAALRAGEIGVLLVAGGQGTRLGFDHPKGMFAIGPVSGATLFQILTEKVVALGRRYGVRMPLYVMTSPATHEETVAFFDAHQRFGLPQEDLRIFCQGTMPAVDAATGKILLESADHLALSPDGHGGMLAALARSGGLDDAERCGLKHFFYMQVDNPLVHAGLPEFLGYHLWNGSEMTTQVVRKHDPLERVGNVVQTGGRLRVIEYSDLPDEVAKRRNADGSLRVWAGSIAVHAMAVDFLRRMAGTADGLPFHIAHKKVPYLDAAGQPVQPEKPNAIKFERFIFDLLPSAEHAIVVEVDAARHFGPLKNAPGAASDTPESVKAQLVALHRQWLLEAGAEVAEGVAVEISPLYALDAKMLAERLPAGTRVEVPTYFH